MGPFDPQRGKSTGGLDFGSSFQSLDYVSGFKEASGDRAPLGRPKTSVPVFQRISDGTCQ
jgi:hypothetical protein